MSERYTHGWNTTGEPYIKTSNATLHCNDGDDVRFIAEILNSETAPLLATIQAQQANLQIAAELLEEERAKVAHRNELLRIQGEACERYKAAIEDARQALSNQTHGGAQYQPDVLEADSILANALEETTANDGTPVIHLPPKASEGAPPPRITYSIDTESEAE